MHECAVCSLKLGEVVLLQFIDEALILGTVRALLGIGAAHFRSSNDCNLRARQLELGNIVDVISLNLALGDLQEDFTSRILLVGEVDQSFVSQSLMLYEDVSLSFDFRGFLVRLIQVSWVSILSCRLLTTQAHFL